MQFFYNTSRYSNLYFLISLWQPLFYLPVCGISRNLFLADLHLSLHHLSNKMYVHLGTKQYENFHCWIHVYLTGYMYKCITICLTCYGWHFVLGLIQIAGFEICSLSQIFIPCEQKSGSKLHSSGQEHVHVCQHVHFFNT